MKKMILTFSIVFAFCQLQAQEIVDSTKMEVKIEDSTKEEEIFAFVEIMPEFPGGEAALLRFLQMNIRYPAEAVTKNIQGTVMVEFIVEKDGSISSSRIMKGIGGGCNEESLRVVKLMPKWKPAKQAGKFVRVFFTVPITFRLQ
jgi:protein TonB